MVAGPPASSNSSPGTLSEAKWVERAFALLATELGPQTGFLLFFAIVVLWLAVSVQLVQIDLYDGRTTIVNSQYFLGISELLLATRAAARPVSGACRGGWRNNSICTRSMCVRTTR